MNAGSEVSILWKKTIFKLKFPSPQVLGENVRCYKVGGSPI